MGHLRDSFLHIFGTFFTLFWNIFYPFLGQRVRYCKIQSWSHLFNLNALCLHCTDSTALRAERPNIAALELSIKGWISGRGYLQTPTDPLLYLSSKGTQQCILRWGKQSQNLKLLFLGVDNLSAPLFIFVLWHNFLIFQSMPLLGLNIFSVENLKTPFHASVYFKALLRIPNSKIFLP